MVLVQRNQNPRSVSVNDPTVGCLVKAFQMRNLQNAHGLDRPGECFISQAVLS